MGYYSELAIDKLYREDHSYTSPEMQLKWRIEDLRSRLDDVSIGRYGSSAYSFSDCRFSKDDLAFAPPEYFSRESDIIEAIAIAEDKLRSIESEGAELRDAEKNKVAAAEIPGQLTIWDIYPACLDTLIPHEEEFLIAA